MRVLPGVHAVRAPLARRQAQAGAPTPLPAPRARAHPALAHRSTGSSLPSSPSSSYARRRGARAPAARARPAPALHAQRSPRLTRRRGAPARRRYSAANQRSRRELHGACLSNLFALCKKDDPSDPLKNGTFMTDSSGASRLHYFMLVKLNLDHLEIYATAKTLSWACVFCRCARHLRRATSAAPPPRTLLSPLPHAPSARPCCRRVLRQRAATTLTRRRSGAPPRRRWRSSPRCATPRPPTRRAKTAQRPRRRSGRRSRRRRPT